MRPQLRALAGRDKCFCHGSAGQAEPDREQERLSSAAARRCRELLVTPTANHHDSATNFLIRFRSASKLTAAAACDTSNTCSGGVTEVFCFSQPTISVRFAIAHVSSTHRTIL